MKIWPIVFEGIHNDNAEAITGLIRKVVPNATLIDPSRLSVLPLSEPLPMNFLVLILCNCENKTAVLEELQRVLASTNVNIRAEM